MEHCAILVLLVKQSLRFFLAFDNRFYLYKGKLTVVAKRIFHSARGKGKQKPSAIEYCGTYCGEVSMYRKCRNLL